MINVYLHVRIIPVPLSESNMRSTGNYADFLIHNYTCSQVSFAGGQFKDSLFRLIVFCLRPKSFWGY